MKILPLILLWFLVPGLNVAMADDVRLTQLRYMTEEYPPFNYREDGELQGIAVDLIRLIWREAGVPEQPIELMPWARAYHDLQYSPNTVLFAVAKTAQRKELFKWACPIVETNYVLIAKKSAAIKIDSVDELNQYNIGTIRSDVSEQALLGLLEHSVNIFSNVSMRPNLAMLEKGRIQLIAYGQSAANRAISEFGYAPKDYEAVYELAQSTTCFAFNKNTDEAILTRFRNILDTVRQRPRFQKLVHHYFHREDLSGIGSDISNSP